MKTTDRELSEKQQLILSRYFDNESGIVERFRARRLLTSTPAARNFLNSLHSISTAHQEIKNTISPSVDLWARVDARIEQETKAAFYLGDRRAPESRAPFFERLKPVQALVGGLSGAVAAAVVLVIMYQPKEIVSFSSPPTASTSRANVFQQVGLGNSRQSEPVTQQLSRQRRSTLEVDWMRANGSLRVIPDADGTSAIIWVHRKGMAPRLPGRGAAPRLQPTPFGRVEPSPIATASHQWLDEKPASGAK